jgi:hypothetical protein
MHCDQCGKENRPGSKFCRFCGNTLSEGSRAHAPVSGSKKNPATKLTWKSPIILILIGLIVLAGLGYGGTKAYAYYQVESKLSAAKKMQVAGDYKGSIDVLNGWESKTFTNGQKTRIEAIKSDNQKFITFKASFDNAVSVQSATSTATTTLAVRLQGALKDLQSIESSYPEFNKVQVEMTKVQNALVVALQDEANTSKKAAADASAQAAKNSAAAAAAQAARARAEQNAATAASNAQAQAAAARGVEVAKGFRNELTAGYISYTQGITYYSSAIKYSNNGDSLLAIAQANSANAVLNSAYSTVSDLNTRFTGLPSSYYQAASDMQSAIAYLSKALDLLVSSEGTSVDYSSTINSNKNTAAAYSARVKAFLDANAE